MNKQAFYRGFLKAAGRHKTAEVDYSAVAGGIGALGGGVLGGLTSREHRMRNALIGAGVGGAAAYGGAKTFQHFYNQDTNNYLSKNLKRDVTGKNQFVLDSFYPDGYGKDPKDIPEFLQKYPNNSVYIDSHGHSYLPGNYRWRPHNPLTGPGSGMTGRLPGFKNQFTLEDIAKQMGPEAAAKIEYFGDMSCKATNCAPTPEDVQKVFKGVKRTMMLPIGGIGLSMPMVEPRSSPYISKNEDMVAWLAGKTKDNATLSESVDQMKKYWERNPGEAIAHPTESELTSTGWRNRGAFNLADKENDVTTPFVFDIDGVRDWMTKNWAAQTGSSQYEHAQR